MHNAYDVKDDQIVKLELKGDNYVYTGDVVLHADTVEITQ